MPNYRRAAARLEDMQRKISQAWKHPLVRAIANDEIQRFIETPSRLAHASLILCGDNPGKQEADASRYFVGPAGQIARAYERAAGIESAIHLNKTPLHTPKTADLKALSRLDPTLRSLLEETQREMARTIVALLTDLDAICWVVGLAGCRPEEGGWPRELKPGNAYVASCILPHFFTELRDQGRIRLGAAASQRIIITKHFSHGQFRKDIVTYGLEFPTSSLATELEKVPYARWLFQS